MIEEHPHHFQIFIHGPGKCEVLYTAERMSLDAAKFAAVDFVATARFGPTHGLKCWVTPLSFVSGLLVN